MRVRATRVLSVAALALLPVLGACGSSDADAAQSISDSIMKDQKSGDDFKVKRSEADCIGEGMVDAVGTEQLQKYGALNEDLKATKKNVSEVKMSKKDARAAADKVVDCADWEKLFTSGLQSSNLTKAQMTCVTDTLDKDTMARLLTYLFSQDQAGGQQYMATELKDCQNA